MNIDKVKQIYQLLGDDTSKYIFENRLMYTLTGNTKFIHNVVCTLDVGEKIYELMKKCNGKIAIFGAGVISRHLIQIYQDIPFVCLIDNKKAGIVYEGLPVLSLSDFSDKYMNCYILISTKLYHKEILQQLLESGFQQEKIINLGMEYEKLNHMQYFDLVQLDEYRVTNEVFVDGGCYDGSSSIDFANWCLEGEVYAWEPDPDNQERCKKKFKENSIKYKFIPKGLWSEKKTLKLKMDKTSSVISNDGDIVIDVDSIDNLVDKPATFIKMDVEGSEYQALLGAKKTIKKYKPKLAISVYHKPEDIYELPMLILDMNDDYTFFIRHYSFADNDTVLYAL